MDCAAVCERFVATHFPVASIAVLAGSTARRTRTPTSDIDLLVVGDELFANGRTSLAGSFGFEGEVFEVFAYTPEAFAEWAGRGVEQHRPVIVQMLVEGLEVRGGRALELLREDWRGRLAGGPTTSPHELDMRRYVVTDLLDDLLDAQDPLEQSVIAFALFEKVGELILLTEKRWIGSGKYLARRLRELDEGRTAQLAAPLLEGDFVRFADRVGSELSRLGGRVQAGFTR